MFFSSKKPGPLMTPQVRAAALRADRVLQTGHLAGRWIWPGSEERVRVSWWVWVLIAIMVGVAIHHYLTFPPF